MPATMTCSKCLIGKHVFCTGDCACSVCRTRPVVRLSEPTPPAKLPGWTESPAAEPAAKTEPIVRPRRPTAASRLAVHLRVDGGSRCGRAGTAPKTDDPAEVTCSTCQRSQEALERRLGLAAALAPETPAGLLHAYPQYPADDYCPSCGLTGRHWDGCAADRPPITAKDRFS